MGIVERLDTVREGMEAGLDDWPIASQIYEYKTAAAEITALRKRVAELEQQLIEVRRAERERCAALCEKSDRYRGDYFADKIRVME